MEAMSPAEEHRLELPDGTHVLVRPIRPEDKDRLHAGFHELTPQSRYFRFHAPVEELDDALLRYLTEIDYIDHMAWVAVDLDTPGTPGMGVARYIRLPHEPSVAEVAVTVVDRYQGRGLGTLLLGMLTASALANGITTFRNYVLADNAAMLGLLDQLGAVRQELESGVYRVDLPLPEDPQDLPDTPRGRVLTEIARGNVPPFCLFFPFSWIRRLGSMPEHRLAAPVSTAGREAPMLREHLDQVLARARGREEADEDGTDGEPAPG
jgi:RimJ/RimL family protein N-acetyltransferase